VFDEDVVFPSVFLLKSVIFLASCSSRDVYFRGELDGAYVLGPIGDTKPYSHFLKL
jgi:hypothetical protein